MTWKFLNRSARVLGVGIFLAQAAACSSLDAAYDAGGAGDGRVIETDSGPVELSGPGGLIVESTLETGVLTITGGADIAEPFAITSVETVLPGHVVVIDEGNPGLLRVSDRAYDTKVAGVVAGAGDLTPGLTLTRTMRHPNEQNVALTGLVYVLADASEGEIRSGDLLATSDTKGHAMRVRDYEKAHGAVLGKAMGSLRQGRGLVLVLVSLL